MKTNLNFARHPLHWMIWHSCLSLKAKQGHRAIATIRVLVFIWTMLLVTYGSTSAQQLASTRPNVDMGDVPARINHIRSGSGLPSLTIHPLLQQAAQTHVTDMITYANWSHIGTDGSRVKDRVLRTGYPLDGWIGENWVSASDSASALAWWMNSPIHRDNILGSSWREVGVGVALDPSSGRTIYVAVFSTGRQASVAVKTPQPLAAVAPNRVNGQLQYTESVNSPPPVQHATLTIRSGDTIFGLSEQYGIPWAELASANGWTKETILQLGELFVVPTMAQNVFVNSQTIESQNYIVQSGDTLISIARDLQVEWQAIAHVNNLHNADLLQVGQHLMIPDSLRRLTDVSAKTNPLHIIQADETIFSLAARYDLDWKTVLKINGLTESSILQIGQQIRLTR